MPTGGLLSKQFVSASGKMTSICRDQSDNVENEILPTGRFWEILPVPADVLTSLDADLNYQSPKPLQRRVLPTILTTPHCSMIVQVSNTAYLKPCQWCALSLDWQNFDLLFAG